MPRLKVSAEEEVANLNRRATETANKSMKRVIELALKNKPSCIKGLYDKLESMGVTAANAHTPESQTMSFQAQAAAKRRGAPSGTPTKQEGKTEQKELVDIEDPISG